MTQMIGPVMHRYCGLLLCLALLIGGGTLQGLWTTQILQLLLLPVVFVGLSGFSVGRNGWLQTAILTLVVVLIGIQFMPSTNAFPEALGLPAGAGFFAQNPMRALEASLFVATVLPLSLVVQRMTLKQHSSLLLYILVGLAINLIVAVLHISTGSLYGPSTPLPYQLLGGLFANPNHFAALLYCSIPVLGLILLNQRQNTVGYIAVFVVILLFQISLGSTAGMAISMVLGILSYFVLSSERSRFSIWAGLGCVGLLILAAVFIAVRDTQFLDLGERMKFAVNTIAAIKDTLPWGTGLGSFVDVYPSYESVAGLSAEYTNHAHNDYLEVILEGGLLTAALLVLFGVRLFVGPLNTAIKKAAMLAVLALLVHSVVDYPLRTMAMAMVFATLCGVIFAKPPEKPQK